MTDPQTELRRILRHVPPGDVLYVPREDLHRYARAWAQPADARSLVADGVTVRPCDVLDPERNDTDTAKKHWAEFMTDANSIVFEVFRRGTNHD